MSRLTLSRIQHSFRNRRALALLPLFALMLIGAFYLFSQEPVFISSGQLEINRDAGADAALATQEQFEARLTSDAFVRELIVGTEYDAALLRAGADSAEIFNEVRANIWPTVIGDQTLAILAKSARPVAAQTLAQNTIDTFLRWETAIGVADAQTAVDFYSRIELEESASFNSAQIELTEFLVNNPQSTESGQAISPEHLEAIETLQTTVSGAEARLTEARQSLNTAKLDYEASLASINNTYLLTDAPALPNSPVGSLSSQFVTFAIFMALGLALGAFIVIVGALTDSFNNRTPKFA